MERYYERLAWTVLLVSFTLCIGLAIGIPLSIQSYVRHSHIGALVSLDAQQPESNILVRCPGETALVGVVDRQDNLCNGREGAQISASSNKGLLTFRTRASPMTILATVQMYPGARIIVQQARAPRFISLSAEPHRIMVLVETGRIRVDVPSNLLHALLVQIYTPHAHVKLTSSGSISIETNTNETQVITREGQVTVTALANGSTRVLETAQRIVVLKDNSLTEIQTAERNLLTGHSDLREPLGSVWKPYTVPPQIPTESPGEAKNLVVEDRQVIELARIGIGHAETGIVQEINRDIRDFRSLQLRLVLRVLQQDVPVCGTLGSECPVMVRIDYVDEEGSLRSWLQGFYVLPDFNAVNPDFCVTCSTRSPHIRITGGAWYIYDSPNLIPLLGQIGAPPVTLKTIWIYASGHTYQSQIAEVELSGQE